VRRGRFGLIRSHMPRGLFQDADVYTWQFFRFLSVAGLGIFSRLGGALV